MAKRIAVLNHKGGVGKSTTTVNLSVALARAGKKVLVIDYDPQANTSQFFGLARAIEEPTLYGAAEFTLGIGEFSPQRNVLVPGLDLVPATDSLFDADKELSKEYDRNLRRLAQAVAAVESSYDFILADCQPTLGFLPSAAVVACPSVLVPVKLAPASVLGAAKVRTHVEEDLASVSRARRASWCARDLRQRGRVDAEARCSRACAPSSASSSSGPRFIGSKPWRTQRGAVLRSSPSTRRAVQHRSTNNSCRR